MTDLVVGRDTVTHAGRHLQFDPLTRLTNLDVIALITEQCPDWFGTDDFFPVPCCFPTCRSVTYLLADRADPPVSAAELALDGGAVGDGRRGFGVGRCRWPGIGMKWLPW